MSPLPNQIKAVLPGRKVAMMVFGYPGVGKTRLAGTGGSKTLIVRPPTDHTDSIVTEGVREWEVNDWQDIEEVYEYLRQGGVKDWDWVWLDSISLFQDHGLDDIWQVVLDAKPHRAQHGLDKGEYGTNMHRLGQWVRRMVTLPGFHFGITAHPFVWDDDPTGDPRLWPYIQGKNMPFKICGYMNIVAYMEVKQDKRVLRLVETDEYFTKDQFDFTPQGRLVEPTMPKIMKAIKAARGGSSDTTTSANKRRPARRRGRSTK